LGKILIRGGNKGIRLVYIFLFQNLFSRLHTPFFSKSLLFFFYLIITRKELNLFSFFDLVAYLFVVSNNLFENDMWKGETNISIPKMSDVDYEILYNPLTMTGKESPEEVILHFLIISQPSNPF
jgi:hypothetical protein